MYMAIAISEVNTEIKLVYGIDTSSIQPWRVYTIYKEYFAKSITLSEAAENIHGVLFDNKLIEGK